MWIETWTLAVQDRVKGSHPAWVCGLKLKVIREHRGHREVTPCVGVWIETVCNCQNRRNRRVTPCVGVWIETVLLPFGRSTDLSHPAWVCGLKHTLNNVILLDEVTPCVGVWIETFFLCSFHRFGLVTPCVGVWIETSNSVQTGWPISSHPAWVYMD